MVILILSMDLKGSLKLNYLIENNKLCVIFEDLLNKTDKRKIKN
jgi:hypothetical protein